MYFCFICACISNPGVGVFLYMRDSKSHHQYNRKEQIVDVIIKCVLHVPLIEERVVKRRSRAREHNL